jgi:hypothetical protein
VILAESFLAAPGDGIYVYIEITRNDELPAKSHAQDRLGSIELVINGIAVLDRHMLDDIDTLWAHVAILIDDYRNGRKASMVFPSEQLEFSFTPIGRGQVVVASVYGGDRLAAAADEHELISVIQQAGNTYFDKMETLTQRFYAKERTLLSGHNPHLST